MKPHSAEAKKFIETLNETDRWINQHPEEVAQILAQSTGINLSVAKLVIEKGCNPAQVNVLNIEMLEAQQEIADLFFNLKLIPNAVQLKDHAWNGE